MSSTIAATLVSQLTVIETFSGADPSNPNVTFAPQNENLTLTGTTTPAVSKQASFSQALTTGAATLDLTALPGITGDETVNGTGLKAQLLKLTNPGTNANKITAGQGASNAYRLDGATNWSVALAPGQSALFQLDGAADTVSSTHKDIDLAGTGSQALSVQIVMG